MFFWVRVKMVHQWVLAGIVAAVLGFLFGDPKRVKSGRGGDLTEKKKYERVKASENGECCSGFDVIVVGAGVAGAALAHTLGKVRDSATLSVTMRSQVSWKVVRVFIFVFFISNLCVLRLVNQKIGEMRGK